MAQPKFLLQPLAAAICVVCYSAAVSAESTSTQHQTLAPIVATAQQGNAASGLIVHADPKQPIQPIPATDGADYLQSIVGFNGIKNGGTNSDVTFRGMFGSRIKILTDGSESLGACPARMDSPTSYISPESYDRISVIKGPQTVQYANTGSAATVIFEREKPELTAEKPYQGQASVLIGSFGRLDHNVEAVLGDAQKYVRLNANRSESNSYQDGDGHSVPSSWERWNTDLAFGWTPNENTWLELTAGKSDGEALYAGREMDGSQFARESLGLRFEKKNITEVIQKVEGQVNYSYNDHVMDNFSLREFKPSAMMTMPMATNVARRTLNTRVAMTSNWENLSLISGLDSQNNEHSVRKGMVNTYKDKIRNTDMEFQSYGLFGELSYALNDQNRLVTGVRVDQVKVEDRRAETSQFNQEIDKTLPSAFIRFENQQPEHNAKSYVGVGYVERMPDYWELFSPKSGNGNLDTFNHIDTEKTLQLDMGYQHEHGAISSWVSAYAGLINDYILTSYTGMSGMLSANSRNVDATIAGAEAGIGYQFTDAIQADVSAMYAWGENSTDHRALPQIAPLEGRVNLRYVQDKYTLGALWRVVAAQDRISLNEGNIVGYDINESKAFNTLALNATYNLMKDVDVAIGVDNLLNQTYTEHLNKAGSSGFGFASNEQFNNTGRNYWARVSMKF